MPSQTPESEDSKQTAQLVRIHESNCSIDYPTEEEQNFRIAIMKKLGLKLGLAEVRNLAIAGSGKGVPRPKG